MRTEFSIADGIYFENNQLIAISTLGYMRKWDVSCYEKATRIKVTFNFQVFIADNMQKGCRISILPRGDVIISNNEGAHIFSKNPILIMRSDSKYIRFIAYDSFSEYIIYDKETSSLKKIHIYSGKCNSHINLSSECNVIKKHGLFGGFFETTMNGDYVELISHTHNSAEILLLFNSYKNKEHSLLILIDRLRLIIKLKIITKFISKSDEIFLSGNNEVFLINKEKSSLYEICQNGDQRFISSIGKNIYSKISSKHQNLFAYATNEGFICVIDVYKGLEVSTWKAHSSEISHMRFDKNGKVLISISKNNDICVHNLDDLTTNKINSVGKKVNCSILYDNYLFIGTNDGYIVRYEINTENVTTWNLNDRALSIKCFAYHSSHFMLAVGCHNSILLLFDMNKGIIIGDIFTEVLIENLLYSEDGKVLVSYGQDFVTALDVDPESWAKKACSIVNRNFSIAEWQRFIGDALPYEKTCPDLPAPGEDGWVEPYAGG